MNRYLIILVIYFASCPVYSSEWQFSQLSDHRESFLFGLITGIAGHELGHISVAKARNINVEYDGVTIIYPDENLSNRERLRVASAGFQAQWLISEAALRYRKIHELTRAGNNFNAGLVWSHLGITAAYITILKNHKDGDIEGMSRATGISNDRLALIIAVPAALDAWRLMGIDVPKWVPAVSIGAKGIGIASIWAF